MKSETDGSMILRWKWLMQYESELCSMDNMFGFRLFPWDLHSSVTNYTNISAYIYIYTHKSVYVYRHIYIYIIDIYTYMCRYIYMHRCRHTHVWSQPFLFLIANSVTVPACLGVVWCHGWHRLGTCMARPVARGHRLDIETGSGSP